MSAPTVPSAIGVQTQVLVPPKILPFVVNLLATKLELMSALGRYGFIDSSEFSSFEQIPFTVRDTTSLHKITGFGAQNIPLGFEQGETSAGTVAPAYVVTNWAVTDEEKAQLGASEANKLVLRRQAQAAAMTMRNFEAHLVGATAWGAATADVFGLAGFNSFDGNVTGVSGILQGAAVGSQTGSVHNLARGTGRIQGSNPAAAPFDWLSGWENVFRDLAGAFSTNILTALRSAMLELDQNSMETAGDTRIVIMNSANLLTFEGLFTSTSPGVALAGAERWTGAAEAEASVTNGAKVKMYAGKYPLMSHPKVTTGAGDTKCGAMIINPSALKLRVDSTRWGKPVGSSGTLPLTIIDHGTIGWRGNLKALHLRSHAWLGDPG